MRVASSMASAPSAAEPIDELFFEHLEQAYRSSEEAYGLADRLRGGDFDSWKGKADGMLSDLNGLVGDSISTAEEAVAYLPDGHAAASMIAGAVDALQGASYVLEEGDGSPVERADEAIDLIDDGKAMLFDAWNEADGPDYL